MKRHFLICKRKERNLSQQQVAKNAGVSQRAYSMIELNQSKPSLDVAFRLEKFFGIPASELLAEEDRGEEDAHKPTR